MPQIFQDFTNSIPITFVATPLAALGNGSSAASDAINNSVTKYLSANVEFSITLGASIAGGTLTIFILRSVDGGATYDDLNFNSEILGVFNADNTVAATTIKFSVDTNIVGSIPDFWKVAVRNDSGAALTAGSATMLAKLLLIA